MNYLAHLYLSGEDPEVLVGNFMGDFIKGKNYLNYPSSIKNGILLHRYIDDFTDTHIKNKELIQEIRPFFGKYSGVALDMIYDHCLAKTWGDFHDKSLEEYSFDVYEQLRSFDSILPEKCQLLLHYMSKDNWLLAYQDIQGIDRAFRGLSNRIVHDNTLYRGREIIEKQDEMLQHFFSKFFPEIINKCELRINELSESA